MLKSFSKFSTMIKVSARIKNLLVLSWSEIAWDVKNICRKYREVSRPLCQPRWQCFKSSVPARPVVLSTWSELVLAAVIKHCSIPHFRGLLNLKTLQPMKMNVKKTKSKKTFSFSIIFKERNIVTLTRILTRTGRGLSTCCTPLNPHIPPLRKRDSRELDSPRSAPACSY